MVRGALRFLAVVTAAVAASGPALAADAYSDNRSDAAAVVRSYYNAVNRHEYARAYGYFGQNQAPSAYDAFVKGYANTTHVEVAIGKALSDGAAGSIYYTLPVAIDARDSKGGHKQFAGCYVLRLVQPTIQEPPFEGMHIEKGGLKPTKGALKAILPRCDN
ncbi:MAG TPA: hypothetical protein VGO70_09535 [Arsenicitalea sp.]|nr:hypothetical protein [Arsenicitalea sp.]